ncbi:hypothetical protein GCM10009633_29990 [Janibacter melonis]
MSTSLLRHPDGTLCRRRVLAVVLGLVFLSVVAAGAAGYVSGPLYWGLYVAPVAVQVVLPSCRKHGTEAA